MLKIEDFDKAILSSIKYFRHIKKFGYIGIMGSMKVNSDLDLLLIPKDGEKLGDFIITLTEFLFILRKKLESEGYGIVIFPHGWFEQEVKWISKRDPKTDFLIHLVSIFGWWYPHTMVAKKIILESIKNKNKTYYGSIREINEIKNFLIPWHYDTLFFENCLISRYPKKLERQKIHELAYYISKHHEFNINYKKSNRKILYDLCKHLDKEYY